MTKNALTISKREAAEIELELAIKRSFKQLLGMQEVYLSARVMKIVTISNGSSKINFLVFIKRYYIICMLSHSLTTLIFTWLCKTL